MSLRHALVWTGVLSLLPSAASAIQYEVFIDVEREEDLYDLLVAGQISEASFDALLLLHQTRVELNSADRERLYLLPNLDYAHVDRILAYREEVGSIHALGDLVTSGALEPDLVTSIEAFVWLRVRETSRRGPDGFMRIQARWSGRHDRMPPAAAIQARVRAARRLDAGVVATLTRNGLGRARWDPGRQALSVEPESVRLEVPKVYLEWEDESWELVAGTYRIGFGQRLTFDVTDQVTPNGAFGDFELRREHELELRCRRSTGELPVSPCPQDEAARVTPDFTWTNRLAGLALGLKRRSVWRGWLQAYAWGSYQVHRAQQIEVVNTGSCDDPRRDDDPECEAPPVYVRVGPPSSPAGRATFATLRAVFAEALAGMNLSYFWNARAHLGLTGYGSMPRWIVRGAELDFQEFARKPFGGPFGAIGINAGYGFRRQDFFAELARSYDRQKGGGGGFAAILRSVTGFAVGELDVSVRYYGSHYANPYARPVSAPDELDGLRARDEAGFRIRATMQPGSRLGVRLLADGWRQLASGSLNALAFVRTDCRIGAVWGLAFWTEYRTMGRRLSVATELVYAPSWRVRLSWQLQHRQLQAPSTRRSPQRDLAAFLSFTAHPIDPLRLRARLRYDFEDLFDNHRLPQTLWAYLETSFTVRERDALRARYDLRVFFDERESTLRRVPNPEHWLWLEFVLRY